MWVDHGCVEPLNQKHRMFKHCILLDNLGLHYIISNLQEDCSSNLKDTLFSMINMQLL